MTRTRPTLTLKPGTAARGVVARRLVKAPAAPAAALTPTPPRSRERAPALLIEKFWAVWCPVSGRPPRKRHATEAAARAEAVRLAQLVPGARFLVYKLILVAEERTEAVAQEEAR